MSCCGFDGQNSRGLQGFRIEEREIDNSDYYGDQVSDILYDDYLLADGIPALSDVAPAPSTGGTPLPTTMPELGNSATLPPPTMQPPPTIIEKLKTTDETDEGYGVDPVKKKFEPYIIGGLVAVGVLFIFGMVKTGGGGNDDWRRSPND